jgi:transketolase
MFFKNSMMREDLMHSHEKKLVRELENKAKVLRRRVIEMIVRAQSGHPGGSLSAADIMAVLFFHQLRIDSSNPKNPDRDRFILSKGHAAPVLYAALAERGFFEPSWLVTFRQLGSKLQGHPDMTKTPGVEMTTGALGQGLSVALGMALGARILKRNFRVYVLLGDGEMDEGQVWEAALAAAHYKADNLTAIIDRNGLQLDGPTEKIIALSPLWEKWAALGWHVVEINGHSVEEILESLDTAMRVEGKPTVIVAHTVKGKGVSFMENRAEWHGQSPTLEEAELALQELI